MTFFVLKIVESTDKLVLKGLSFGLVIAEGLTFRVIDRWRALPPPFCPLNMVIESFLV